MSDAIDLYGGSVEIYFKDGQGVIHSIQKVARGISDNNSYIDPSYVNFVTSVKVDIDLIKFTKIEIELDPTITEAVNLIESSYIGIGYSPPKKTGSTDISDSATAAHDFGGFNKICVKINYGGRSSSFFEGYLVAPDISVDAENITIKLHGIGLLFDMTKTSSGKVFDNHSQKTILTESSSEGKSFFLKVEDPKAIDLLSVPLKTISTGTDWVKFNEILKRNQLAIIDLGTGQSPQGKTTYEIISRDYLRKRTKDKSAGKFVAFGQIDPNNGIYPILSLRTSITNHVFGQSIGKTIKDVSSDTGQVTNSPVGAEVFNKNTDKVSSTDGTVGATKSDPSQTREVIAAPQSRVTQVKNTIKDGIQSVFQYATENALSMDITTIGVPDLLPGKIVNINIANISFLKGDYDLISVSHTISESGCETSMKIAKTAGFAGTAQNLLERAAGATAGAINSISKAATGKGVISQ